MQLKHLLAIVSSRLLPRLALLALGALTVCCGAGRGTGRAAQPLPTPTPADSASSSAEDEVPKFATLGQDRAAISLDYGLSSEDLEALVLEDKRATKCTDAMIRAHWQQDIARRLSAEAHFDNCEIRASVAYLREEYLKAEQSATGGDVFVALRHLGHVLHSVEDFFAHTNFVEIAAEKFPKPEAVPVLMLWDPSSDALLAEFDSELLSGWIFTEAIWKTGACAANTPSHGSINKDSPQSERGATLLVSWGMSHYQATRELTRRAAGRLLRETLKRQAWAPVRQECGTMLGFSLRPDHRTE